jgi:hypothetical protein
LSFQLPEREAERLRELAAEQHRTVSGELRLALTNHLESTRSAGVASVEWSGGL